MMTEHALVSVNETFSLEHAIGHVFDLRFRTCTILETDRVTDLLTKTTPDLFCDTLRDGHGSDTSRLSAPDLSVICEASFCEVLRHLGRLSRTCVTDNDENLMFSNSIPQFVY
jgi:hypothetical protein